MYSLLYSIDIYIYIIVSKLINSVRKLTITSSSRPSFPSLPRTCVTQLSFSSWDRRSDVMWMIQLDVETTEMIRDEDFLEKRMKKDVNEDNKLWYMMEKWCSSKWFYHTSVCKYFGTSRVCTLYEHCLHEFSKYFSSVLSVSRPFSVFPKKAKCGSRSLCT